MRILVIHPRMSVFGGGERVAVNSIITALNRGHEVRLLSEEFDVAAFEDFFACQGLFKKIRMITYPSFRPVARRAVLYQRLLYHQWRVRKSLPKAGEFDLILSTQDVAYLPHANVPIIQYCYFPEYFVHLESNPSSSLWKTYYWPATLFYHKRVGLVDRLLSTSNFTKGFVREKWHRESTTLYPPCPIELYKDLDSPKEDLVVTVGRVVPEKRMDLFLEMARELPKARFVIIGSVASDQESYLQHLRKIAPPNVSFVVSPLRRVRDVLARSKVYVHCARNEHFGITIVEAMAAGCVPVVNDSGGPREIVTDATGSKWTIVEDAVKQISDLITNDSLRMRLSEAARSRADRFGSEAFQSGLGEALVPFENLEHRDLSS